MEKLGALVFVQITEGASPLEVARALKDRPGVEEVMLISGQWDLLIRFSYTNMDALSNFVVSHLRKINGVSKTDTTIILDKVK